MPPFHQLPHASACSSQGAATTSPPARAQPSGERCFETSTNQHGPLSPAGTTCASSPEAELALRMVEGLFGCPSAITGPRPSLRSGLAGHPRHVTGLAEGLLLTADTFGLTVNNKTKKSMYSYTAPASSRLHRGAARQRVRDKHAPLFMHRVLAENISFPLTTNPSGKGKKRILPPGEIEIKSRHCQITSK